MSTVTASNPSVPRGRAAWRRPRRWPLWVAAVVGAWVVPLGAHLVGAGWLVPILAVVFLAGLQRGRYTIVARLTLSVVQLFGALCVAGLVFSVWPWHLHPVAVGGAALCALVGLALAGSRAWTMPRRPTATDLIVIGAAAGAAVLTLVPFGLRDLGGRLGILMLGEDLARHLLLYDAIGQVGGYAFLHPERAAPLVPDHLADGIRNYPQGVHLAYAVLDRFVRSSDHNTDAITELRVMLWLYVATFLFLVVATLWSLCRVAGPGARPARLIPVVVLATVWLFFGDLVGVFLRGYPNELVGLALAAVLTAIVVRPLSRRADQLASVLLLIIGISFSYHLFLPYAGILAVVWAWRARLFRRPLEMIIVAAVAPVIILTPVLNIQAATAQHLGTQGTALITDLPAAVALILLSAAAVIFRRGLRSPARRVGAIALAASLAILSSLALFQLVTVGHTSYYLDKMWHLITVVGLVLLGALARLIPRRGSGAGLSVRAERAPARTATGLALVVALVIALVALGGPTHTQPGSYGLRFALGIEKGSPAGGRDALLIARRYPDGGGGVDVDLMATPYRNFYATLFASAIQRNYRYGHEWYGFLNPIAPPRTLDDLEDMVVTSPVTVRFWLYRPQASMLVIDPAHPNRQWTTPGADPSAFGDPDALTNIEAAEYLAKKYPEKVRLVYAEPSDR